jgi:uncharacterized membrane protein YkvA (DUF1232 family)
MSYESHYSEASFWKKVKGTAASAGKGVVEPAFKMYFALLDDDTPAWAKATIIGALGYFISPIDAIPDITPVVGYADDLGVVVGALATVAAHVKKEHKRRAKQAASEWFD